MVKPWTSLDSKVSFVSNKSVIKCRQLFEHQVFFVVFFNSFFYFLRWNTERTSVRFIVLLWLLKGNNQRNVSVSQMVTRAHQFFYPTPQKKKIYIYIYMYPAYASVHCSGFLRLNCPPLPSPAKKCTYVLNANVKPHSIFNWPTATESGQDSCVP